jgi:solute carrier family 13 (sodium-dependent dicarboxylate transporter), member 2/3/5
MSDRVTFADLMANRRVRKIILGLLIGAVLVLIPTPPGLTLEGQRTIALLVVVVFFWITEVFPLPVTALAAGAGLVLLGVHTSPNKAFAPYAEDTVFFILGSLILAQAIGRSGADRALASTILRHMGHSKDSLLWAVLIISSTFAMVISDHAVAAIMLAIVIAVIQNSPIKKDVVYQRGLIIAVAFGASISGLATPSGGARNAVAIGYMRDLYDVQVSYLQWMMMGVPITILLVPVVFFLVKFSFRIKNERLDKMKVLDVPVTKKHMLPISILLFTVVLWVTLGTTYGLGVIAIVGATLMFAFGVLDWEDARRGIAWGVPFIYGAALTLGRSMQTTGAADWITGHYFSRIPFGTEIAILISIGIITVIATNFMSDGAAVAVVAPFSLALANLASPGDPTAVMFAGVLTAICSAFAFVLVIGTPPNVMAYSTGYARAKDFMRVGLPLTGTALALTLAVVHWWWPRVV